MTAGVKHEALGMFLFAVTLGLLLSSDYFLMFLGRSDDAKAQRDAPKPPVGLDYFGTFGEAVRSASWVRSARENPPLSSSY